MHFLNDHERMQLKIQHKHERDGRVRDRIKAVLLTNEGWTPQQIAKVLLISDQAVREHVHEYKLSKKLKPDSGGSEEKLSEEQSKQLAAHSYSPNLNPIERLWKWMKERVVYNTYYEYFEEFKAAVMGFFGVLATVAAESILGQMLRNRVKDRFSPIET